MVWIEDAIAFGLFDVEDAFDISNGVLKEFLGGRGNQ